MGRLGAVPTPWRCLLLPLLAAGAAAAPRVLTLVATREAKALHFFTAASAVTDVALLDYGTLPLPCPACVTQLRVADATKWQLLSALTATPFWATVPTRYDWLFFPDDGAGASLPPRGLCG